MSFGYALMTGKGAADPFQARETYTKVIEAVERGLSSC